MRKIKLLKDIPLLSLKKGDKGTEIKEDNSWYIQFKTRKSKVRRSVVSTWIMLGYAEEENVADIDIEDIRSTFWKIKDISKHISAVDAERVRSYLIVCEVIERLNDGKEGDNDVYYDTLNGKLKSFDPTDKNNILPKVVSEKADDLLELCAHELEILFRV